MMGIVEFLEARIAEDEAVAKAARPGPWFHDSNLTCGPRVPPHDFLMVPEDPSDAISPCNDKIPDRDSRHIARHNPARALAEVAAKRELLELHYDGNPGPGDIHYCGTCHDYYKHDAEDWPCETVRVLASTFSDHPDFNEEWRP